MEKCVNIYRAKQLLEIYGNVVVLEKDYSKPENGFISFVDENKATVTGPYGVEKYMVITCKGYKMSEEEKGIKKSRFYNQYGNEYDYELLTADELLAKRDAILKEKHNKILKDLEKRKRNAEKLSKKTQN